MSLQICRSLVVAVFCTWACPSTWAQDKSTLVHSEKHAFRVTTLVTGLENPWAVAFLPDGRLQLLCRSKNGLILESFSGDQGKTWSALKATSLPNPNSGTDAVTLQDGRHVLVYNHVTKESQAWGGRRSPLNVAISKDGQKWDEISVLENEPKAEFSYPAVIQTKDGKIHITYTWKREKIKHVVIQL